MSTFDTTFFERVSSRLGNGAGAGAGWLLAGGQPGVLDEILRRRRIFVHKTGGQPGVFQDFWPKIFSSRRSAGGFSRFFSPIFLSAGGFPLIWDNIFDIQVSCTTSFCNWGVQIHLYELMIYQIIVREIKGVLRIPLILLAIFNFDRAPCIFRCFIILFVASGNPPRPTQVTIEFVFVHFSDLVTTIHYCKHFWAIFRCFLIVRTRI